MLDAVQQALLRLLRVPPQPDPPLGAPGSVRVFRAARNFLWYNVFGWALKQAGALWGLVVGLGALSYAPEFPMDEWVRVAEAVGIGVYVLQLPATLVGVFLDFRMRWYIVTDRSLRIREGIWKVNEKTMSFANIQNLGVKQGPVQRLLGISDLEVKTAGGGESKSAEAKKKGESLHTGYFHGVDNAEEIKRLVLERLRRLHDSGLGDPDEAASAEALPSVTAMPAAAGAPARLVLDACRQLGAAARELRAAVGG